MNYIQLHMGKRKNFNLSFMIYPEKKLKLKDVELNKIMNNPFRNWKIFGGG